MARDAERVPPTVLQTLKAPAEEGNGQSLCSLDWTLPWQKQRLELRPGPSLELDLKLALTVLLPQPCLEQPLEYFPDAAFHRS